MNIFYDFKSTRRMASRIILIFFLIGTILPPLNIRAQNALNFPAPGTIISLTQSFKPLLIKGIAIDPHNPFNFNFIVDSGNSDLTEAEVKEKSQRLINYFLASLAIPNEDLWVNLSPYEKSRIIPEAFGQTEMGRDLLSQDYLLKQLTSSLMYPEGDIGEKFWEKIYDQAYRQYGISDIPINTFNKVWIIPESATVYENEDRAFIVDQELKVMLEEDYLALKKNNQNSNKITKLSSKIIRNIIIPQLEKEVNHGQHFIKLRQIYHSMILATWFKQNLKKGLLGQKYIDQEKIRGIEIKDKEAKEKIYQRYLQAFQTGIYNYIREEYNPATKNIVPRKYFSGGVQLKFGDNIDNAMLVTKKNNVLKKIGLTAGAVFLVGGIYWGWQEYQSNQNIQKIKEISIQLNESNNLNDQISTLEQFASYKGNPHAAKALKNFISNTTDSYLQETAIQTLYELETDEGLKFIFDLLQKSEGQSTYSIFDIFSLNPNVKIVPPLIESILKEPDPAYRYPMRLIGDMLKKLQNERIAIHLLAALNTNNQNARSLIVEILGNFNPEKIGEDAMRKIINQLGSIALSSQEPFQVNKKALIALGKLSHHVKKLTDVMMNLLDGQQIPVTNHDLLLLLGKFHNEGASEEQESVLIEKLTSKGLIPDQKKRKKYLPSTRINKPNVMIISIDNYDRSNHGDEVLKVAKETVGNAVNVSFKRINLDKILSKTNKIKFSSTTTLFLKLLDQELNKIVQKHKEDTIFIGNLSFTAESSETPWEYVGLLPDTFLKKYGEQGVVFFAAIGNSYGLSNSLEQRTDNAYYVAASSVETPYQKASYSTYGPQVDFTAPPMSIKEKGTSVSSPVVVGLFAKFLAKNVSYSIPEAMRRFHQNAAPLTSDSYGKQGYLGRLVMPPESQIQKIIEERKKFGKEDNAMISLEAPNKRRKDSSLETSAQRQKSILRKSRQEDFISLLLLAIRYSLSPKRRESPLLNQPGRIPPDQKDNPEITSSAFTKGGIDLNSDRLNIKSKGKRIKFTATMGESMLTQDINIEGLVPMIQTVIPVMNLINFLKNLPY